MVALDIPNAGSGNINPVRSAKTVTPHDTNELDVVTRALKIGNTAGNIVVQMADSEVTTTIPVQAGDWLPIQVRKVLSTGTTASTITGFW